MSVLLSVVVYCWLVCVVCRLCCLCVVVLFVCLLLCFFVYSDVCLLMHGVLCCLFGVGLRFCC